MLTANDYRGLYSSCGLTEDKRRVLELDYVSRVALANQIIYQAVQKSTSIPWPLISAIHFRESGQCFKSHLHNGDSLLARTIHVPIGRPVTGLPPFTWIDSAIDAFKDIWRPVSWDIPGCLEFLERYNGLGYQSHSVNSPYLWDYTNHYASGLFVSDGSFDAVKKESRPGCVAILKVLAMKGISLDFTEIMARDTGLH